MHLESFTEYLKENEKIYKQLLGFKNALQNYHFHGKEKNNK